LLFRLFPVQPELPGLQAQAVYQPVTPTITGIQTQIVANLISNSAALIYEHKFVITGHTQEIFILLDQMLEKFNE
jgi:hypothetical protein